MTWRVAHSLNVLLDQLNKMYPYRDKASDGSIGDAAHSARVSDHNPDSSGVVRARDFTHDPQGGIDCNKLASWLVNSGDKRINYIIWNHKIWDDGHWSVYSGTDPHTKHLHLSVVRTALADSKKQWTLSTQEDDDMPDLNDLLNTKVGTNTNDELSAWSSKPGTLGHFLLGLSQRVNRLLAAAEQHDKEN